MSWRIGRVAGIELRIHYTFPLLLVWMVLGDLYGGGNTLQVVRSAATTLCIFGVVVLHELAHALAARRFGVRTHNILLLPLGGIASLASKPRTAREETWIAVAGPMVNVVIALALFAVLSITSHGIYGARWIEQFARINLGLAGFNLLPAFPLDGGRVFRALLTRRLGERRATEIAVRLGQALAIALGVLGVLFDPMLLVIAIFVWFGAAAEGGLVQR